MKHSFALRMAFLSLLLACLSACQTTGVGGSQRLSLADQIRGVGTDQDQGLQIFGLRNPEVSDLMAQAMQAERKGALRQAVSLLDQALAIEPNAPDILQQLAEVKLEQGRWREAQQVILRSIELGPRLGHLCKRNYRALDVAYQRMGQANDAAKARARVPFCERSAPERF